MLAVILALLSGSSLANPKLIGEWDCSTTWQGQNGESGFMHETFRFQESGMLEVDMDYDFSYPDGLIVNVSFLASGEWELESESSLVTRYKNIQAIKSTDGFLDDEATKQRVISAHFKDGINHYTLSLSDFDLQLNTVKRRTPIECKRSTVNQQ